MSSDFIKAYRLGKRLALIKLSQTLEAEGAEEDNTRSEVDELTKKLDDLTKDYTNVGRDTNILDSSERSSTPTWGDKLELETNSNTGINV